MAGLLVGGTEPRAVAPRVRLLRPSSNGGALPAPLPAVRSGDLRAVPLIAREAELAELRTGLAAALSGEGRVVLLGGEPGIGKTRLASALAAEAEADGVPVLWGRGWQDGSAPAFWPWNTALRRWMDRGGEEAAVAAAGAWSTDLAHVFPVLEERIPGVVATSGGGSDRARFRLFDIVSRFLAMLARPAGLVVVLDDVHWADGPSLKLLEFLAADVPDARLLVVATYRDTEVHRDDPFAATLSALARERSTRRLLLGGLSPAECASWVAAAGTPGDAAALGDALHRETNGNPFFLGELVRLIADERGEARWEARPLPQGVREVIDRRLERLGPDCRSALAVAALLGDSVDGPVLADVLADDRTAQHLERAVRDRILQASETRSDRYAFAHALIRRVLKDEHDAAERAAWHARIAAVLERRSAACGTLTTELVRHLAAAGTPEALAKAFDHAVRGAEQAARGLGWEEAVRLYELALDVGTGCGSLDHARALDVTLALARALRGAGDIAAARARCEEIIDACRRTPRPELLARAALVHVGPIPEFGRVAPSDRAVLEEACRSAEQIDDGLKARLYARLAGDLIAANETEQADRVISLCERAAAAAERARDEGALAMALLGSLYAAALRFRPRSAAAGAPRPPDPQRVLDAAEAGGEHEIAAAVRHLRAVGLFAEGRADGFAAEVDALATAAEASRVPDALCLADHLAAMRAIVEGRFGEADDLMERALATGRRVQLANAVGRHLAQRIFSHFVRGRLGDIADEVEAYVGHHPGGGNGWGAFRALARLARGEVAKARDEFEMLLAGAAPVRHGVMSRCALAGLAHLCIELGDRDRAPELYERIARRRDVWSVDGCHTFGPWAYLLGGLARLCDRLGDSLRHYEEALAHARRMRARPFAAAAQAALAEARIATDPRAARDPRIVALLDEAGSTAAELGLAGVAARVERLQAAGARGSAPNVLRCDGDVWSVAFAGRELLIKDGKGPRYLATLLAAPGREFHVLELAGGLPDGRSAAAPEGLTIGRAAGPIEDAPDARARREYRAQVEELRAEIEEAEENCDRGRAERLRVELDHLVSQLAQSFGSRVRTRGPAETARKAVTKVLRTQIEKLLDVHPELGEHLRQAVRTGTFCRYAPATAVDWEVGIGGVARARR